MKLSEYISELQEFLKEHGDIECYYASDDEGNSYQSVGYAGSLMYKMMDDNDYHPSLYCEEDLEEYEDDEFEKVCVVN